MEAGNTTDRQRLQIIGAFAAIYLIWGSTYVPVRFAIESMPPYLMAAVRFFTAGILMYGWMRLRGAPRPEKAHLLPTAIIGLLMLVMGSTGVVLF
jgi:drug/metabolite transporter (DMT)-like permease